LTKPNVALDESLIDANLSNASSNSVAQNKSHASCHEK